MFNTTYLIWMTASILIACCVHWLVSSPLKKRGLLVGLTLLFGTVLGALMAKVGYCLLQLDYAIGYGLVDVLLSDDMSMVSYYSGMLGVILGVVLAAKCTGNSPMKALNIYAPAGALLASLARFGEHFLDMVCAGNYIEDEALCFFPFGVSNEWDEWYVAVHLFAGVGYLVIALVSLLKFKEKKFMRTLFYLCLVQVFFESLRNQSLFWFQFLRVEQLLCMIVVESILLWLGIGAKNEKRRFFPAIAGILCAGVFVAVEFAVGGKLFEGVNILYFYGVMILGLILLALMENWLIHRQPR